MSALEAATLPIMLTELRLPTIKRLWPALAEQSNREGWPAERFLAALCEHEMNERERRRIDRHRAESGLPPDKGLSAFDFAAVPRSPKPMSPRLPRAIAGSNKAPTFCCSARRVSARRT